MRVECFFIDFQHDFCDPTGNLFVTGAEKDVERVAKMMERLGDRVDDYHATLDTHHLYDVAHPIFWLDKNGNHPNPFTLISHEDVSKGIWRPTDPGEMDRMLKYTETLAKNGRYVLCIWPPHCLIGSTGYRVSDPVYNQFIKWEQNCTAMVDYVTKGSNYTTEHYSVLVADVPDPADPSTQLNVKLIDVLQKADILIVAGEAKSHCVKFSIEDLFVNFGKDSIEKVYLLEDAMSSVPGFEKQGDEFMQNAINLGAKISTTDKILR